jgi:hypothetical protein
MEKDSNNNEETIDLISKDVLAQFERIFDAKDSLEQKTSSFIGFVSIFFGLLLAIILSDDILSIFNDSNIWTLVLFGSMIFIYLIIAIFLAFLVIFGHSQYMGPDLISLYNEISSNKNELKELIVIEYIESTYQNTLKSQTKMLEWQLSILFTVLVIIGLGLCLVNIAVIRADPNQIFMGIIGPATLIILTIIGIFKIRKDLLNKTIDIKTKIEAWNNIIGE